MAPFFILIKYLFTVTFPEVTPIQIAAYNVCTPIRSAPITNTDYAQHSEDVPRQERSRVAAGSAKWGSLLGRQFGGFLQGKT